MSSQQQKNLQADGEVLGYVLKERIGAGGYGEVWSAEAPGGMLKALKFIFGFHDEKRAQRELKALDRIKHIRHPFLLSLERIDVIDGRMVVITELADMCMKVRFNKCVMDGQVGIEREELLRYMAESAEALDYIADSFNLAHLDVKPENILLIGSHAKVADFGLVKDLQTVNQSLMEGLTPAYAAPELFDGQPGRASDQYSLAIVYQEMLTGSLPFSGTTAAQLANQHLHSRPNLNDLPRGDQAVIAKALSKQSEKRYPDCRTMVEELVKRRSRVRRSGEQAKLRRQINTQEVTNAELDVSALKPDMTMTVSESFVPAIKFEGEIEKLEPFRLDESQATFRPTLIIGVGHTGARILCRLRQKLSSRIASAEEIPAIRMLCIDVDRRTLFDATMGEDGQTLRNHETLTIPLRKPEEYRTNTSLDVSWIGRRWLYNIPKSLLTESLRPLGRLAFVDHHEQIFRKITDELQKAVQPEHIASTSEALGMLPSDMSPQVLFVGSVAGGTGSGMLLDLAFTTRMCMAESGMTDDHLFGIFCHSTSRKGGDHRLAIANSYSFLSEMYHYNLNGYPGNSPCEIPAFDDQTPAFDGSYFVHFGDDVTANEFNRSVDGIAEYLFMSTSSRCKSFFDACRDTSEFEAGMLKTMGISYICKGQDDLSVEASDNLVERLLTTWLEGDASGVRLDAEDCASEILANSVFSPTELESRISTLVHEHMGDEPLAQLKKEVDSRMQPDGKNAVHPLRFARAQLDDILGVFGPEVRLEGPFQRSNTEQLCNFLDIRIPAIGRKSAEEMTEAVMKLIDHPDFRIAGAQAVVDAIESRIQELEISLDRERSVLKGEIDECQKYWKAEMKKTGKEAVVDPDALLEECVSRLVRNQLLIVILSYQKKLVRVTANMLAVTFSRISEHRRNLDLMRSQLRLPVDVNDMYDQPAEDELTLYKLLINYANDQTSGLVNALDKQISHRVLEPSRGLLAILSEGSGGIRALPAAMKREAQNLVCRHLQELRLDSMMVESKLPAETIANWISKLVYPATPFVQKCGGQSRLLIAVPQKAPIATLASFIQNQLDHEANIIPSTCGEFVVCMEMDLVPADNVAMSILQMQPDCAELIDRLHCRNDVEWTSLTPLC